MSDKLIINANYACDVTIDNEPLSVTETNALTVTNVIDTAIYDLNAVAFSETTNISNDYELDSIELNFSTTESKTITITSSDGTKLYEDTNTKQSISIVDIGISYDGGDNITVAVTQFASAGTMDCIVKVKQGSNALSGNSVLGAGSDVIGKVILVDSGGQTLDIESNGGMSVNLQDQNSGIVSNYIGMSLGSFTIASNTSIDDVVISLTAGHGAQVGEYVCLKEDCSFYQGMIIGVVTNDITLDTLLDFAFTTDADCCRQCTNMNVDGSSTTQVFSISPIGLDAGNSWDITRLRIMIVSDSAIDSDTFGDLTALTNGVVFRKKDGTYKNIITAKTNLDIQESCDDVEYLTKPLYSLSATCNFAGQEMYGVSIRLTVDTADELQILIRDDLTDLHSFRIKAMGHVVCD